MGMGFHHKEWGEENVGTGFYHKEWGEEDMR